MADPISLSTRAGSPVAVGQESPGAGPIRLAVGRVPATDAAVVVDLTADEARELGVALLRLAHGMARDPSPLPASPGPCADGPCAAPEDAGGPH